MTDYITRANTGYKINGVDLASEGLVTKEYLMEVYPSLLSTLKGSSLWVWGYDGAYGRLGRGVNGVSVSSPIQTIAGGANWTQTNNGMYWMTGIKSDGTAWSWGYNNYGQLGTGNITHRSSPVQILGSPNNWKLISCSQYNAVSVKTDGTLWSWGRNNNGQIGNATNGATLAYSSPVQTVSGGSTWVKAAIAADGLTAHAIKSDGTLWNWGNNSSGDLGFGDIVHRSSPVQVIGSVTNWRQVSAEAYIDTENRLWLVGGNSYGQLGDDTTIAKSSPVQTIAGGNNWKSVSRTTNGVAAIKTDGTLWAWGHYQITADLTTSHRSSPIQTISGGTNWYTVDVKSSFNGNLSAAIKTDGTLWVWGDNRTGALGTGRVFTNSVLSPTQTLLNDNRWKLVSCGGYQNIAGIRENGDEL